MRCALIEQVIGLPDSAHCGVEAAACHACGKLAPPSASRLNEVVSSLIYNAARRAQCGGSRQIGFGQAWQAERYALMSLAQESTDAASAQIEPPADVLRPVRSRFTRRSRTKDGRQRSPVIGLAGFGGASGLGYLNQDLARHLAVDGWLCVDDPNLPPETVANRGASTVQVKVNVGEAKLRRWLRDFDWIVWAEASPLKSLPRLARQAGVRVACVPMWEWISPTDDWLRSVDLLICPTRHAFQMFTEWKTRFGFDWRLVYFPWPVAVDRFPYRLRRTCRTFVFVNGHGGAWAREIGSEARVGPRKGLDLVLAAARLTPEIDWIVYSQAELRAALPENVDIRTGPVDHADLYHEGDVCVQPSRWEGLGLQLLECQAAGMPLITVDAPPMNEYRAMRTVTAARSRWSCLRDAQPINAPELDPAELAQVACDLHGADLQEASALANRWILTERSWEGAVRHWRQIFSEVHEEILAHAR